MARSTDSGQPTAAGGQPLLSPGKEAHLFERLIADLTWTAPACPGPPAWRLDWPAVEDCYPWLRELNGVPQDPIHHAEGDVLVHTRLAAEALAGQPAWRACLPTERSLLFLAVLLHDLGKADRTRADDGRIIAPDHARVSAYRARALLWSGDDGLSSIPFAIREAVARLVRLHGLPLWFLDRPDPRRAVVLASQVARLDHLALLAEADARGRTSADPGQLLDRLALFRDYSAEQGCLDRPRAFASDHARFLYCRGERDDPDAEVYDDRLFTVTLLAGLPAAGKDTWLAEQAIDRPAITLDAIREELHWSPRDGQAALGHAARERARHFLRRRQPFIWNATNVSRRLRSSLIDLFAGYRASVQIVYLDAPLPVLLTRNQTRAQPVPEAVIRRLLNRLDVPDLTEAHRVEWLAR